MGSALNDSEEWEKKTCEKRQRHSSLFVERKVLEKYVVCECIIKYYFVEGNLILC